MAGVGQDRIRFAEEWLKGKGATDLWLAQQLRPYGIKPKGIRIGDKVLKGYLYVDLLDVFRRYLPKSELDALLAEHAEPPQSNAQ